MALDNYADFQAAIADQLARTDLTTQIVDCITLFEAEAAKELFHDRLSEKTTIVIPSNPPTLAVSNAANNGSGLIRLTISSTATLTTNQEVTVANVGGTTEANASWDITVIDGTNIDLQGSSFSNAYTGGGTVQAIVGVVTLPSDYVSWRRATWTGNPNQELEYVQPSILHAYYPNAQVVSGSTGAPQYFTIEGNVMTVRPYSGTPIEFDYFAGTASLSSSLNWLFTNHVDCYWNGVLEQVYSYLKDYEQASVYQSKKMGNYDAIKKFNFRQGTAMTVRVFGICP